jgi:hypothetical protein
MAIDLCLRCGKGIAQHGGLCADCMLNTDITDKLNGFNQMPKIDIPHEIFFGPDLTDYVISLKVRSLEALAKYNKDNKDTNNKDAKKYDVMVARNGKNSSTTGADKMSINSIVYDILLNRNRGILKPDVNNKYKFMLYKPSVTSYSSGKKSSYGVTPSTKYFGQSNNSYNSKPAAYAGSKSTYSGTSGTGSKSSYSGMRSSK